MLVRHYKSKKSVDFFIYSSLDTLFGTVSACDDAAIEIEESETHYETIQEIAPSENEGRATVRIHSVDDDNYRMIADNGPTSETNETLN